MSIPSAKPSLAPNLRIHLFDRQITAIRNLPSLMISIIISFLSLVILAVPREPAWFVLHWLKSCGMISAQRFKMPIRKRYPPPTKTLEKMAEATTILDLPELPLECILEALSPTELCNMACVCSSLRERCRSDHLWERHIRKKWGRILGMAARREWESYVSSKKDPSHHSMKIVNPRDLMGSMSCVWPCLWTKFKLDGGSNGRKIRIPLPIDSIMSWYLALERGQFRFPAQVYNREKGHVGFMLSCYDAELSYDSRTDTFLARYPPHVQRDIHMEVEVRWDRLRAPPVDTLAYDLHDSRCLNDLRPGDHIEIQWRKNKGFPYGWWYGVAGHLEACDKNERHCLCHTSDIVTLEFNHYSRSSEWSRRSLNRKYHREEGDETSGFYGGIRKLLSEDEISAWKQLWPSELLE